MADRTPYTIREDIYDIEYDMAILSETGDLDRKTHRVMLDQIRVLEEALAIALLEDE